MVNSSINSSTAAFGLFYCSKAIHPGVVMSYVAVLLCFFFGTPAHSWILRCSLRGGFKIKPTQVFPLNITALELLISIFTFFYFLNMLIFHNTAGANMGIFIFGVFWISRLLFQVCICLEQYLAVLHPVTFLKYKGIQNRIVIMAVVWLVAGGFGLSFTFEILTFPDYVFLFACLTGMTVISFCYVAVLRTLRHSGPRDREIAMDRGRAERNQQKRNAFNTISGSALIIMLSYSPLITITVFKSIHIDVVLFQCELVPAVVSINLYSIIIPPFWKLYKSGELKCLRKERGN